MASGLPQGPERLEFRALVATLGAAVLGAALGALYGESMWLASGAAPARIARLEQTIAQKQRFAQAAQAEGRPAEAQRLRAQVPVLRREIQRLDAAWRQTQRHGREPARCFGSLIRLMGNLFLRLLLLVVLPLVFISMVCGIAALGSVRCVGRLGAVTLFYYLATSAAAVLLGMLLVEKIQPGHAADDTFAYVDEQFLGHRPVSLLDTLVEVAAGEADRPGSGIIPANLVAAAAQTNVLAVILFALCFGAALGALGEKGQPAVDFFHTLNEALMKLVRWIIALTPVGVFALIASQIAQSGGGRAFLVELQRLGWFVATVSLGLAIHFLLLCLILKLFARRRPLQFVYQVARALLTAVGTDSSSATLPVTIACVQRAGVSPRAAGFVLPLGATVNMDGTALYEAVAAIFIAQSAGISLSGAALVIIFLTATLAAVGAPGIPNAGLVTLLIVLAAVNLPAAGIGTILAVDWFLDRQRTTVNVFGDAVGAAVIDRYLGNG